MTPYVGKLMAVCLLAILSGAIYVAGSWGLADLYLGYPRARYAHWLQTGKGPETAEWRRASRQMDIAWKLDNHNPFLLEDLGRLRHWQAVGKETGGAEAVKDLRQALEYYRRALQVRPVWSYTWVNLIRAKVDLRQYDGELGNALRNAVELGPWVPLVQRTVADAGLRAWRQLDGGTRAAVITNIRRGLKHQAATMMRAAIRHKRVYLLKGLTPL